MSCARGLRRVAAAARRVGLAAGGSMALYFLGRALVNRPRGRNERPPVLAGPERVEPLAEGPGPGQSCAACRAPADKPGPWYRLGGRVYCQDCAPEAARQARVQLIGAGASGPARPDSLPRASLAVAKPARLKVGPVDNVDGYRVYMLGKDTGLSLTPEVNVTGGKVSFNRARWYVTWNRAGQAVAGPFGSVKQAEMMAGLLAEVDWNRPVEAFSNAEIRQVVEIANRYRRVGAGR